MKKEYTLPGEEKIEVYKCFINSTFNSAWIMIPIPSIIVSAFFMPYYISVFNFMISSAILVSIPVIRLIIFPRLYIYFTFKHFRFWRERLPFMLEGWDKIVDSDNFIWPVYWQKKVTLKIQYTPAKETDYDLIGQVLSSFTKKVNDEFYRAEYIIPGHSGDPRKKWSISGFTASGSANNQVVYQIYLFLKNELTPFALKYRTIEHVILDSEGPEYYIPPLRSDTEGCD